MIKKVSRIVSSKPVILPSVEINDVGNIKYIGQSGTSGYASAAKGYLANYVLRNVSISWMPLLFDNSNNDKNYYVDVLAESAIGLSYDSYDTLILHSTPDIWKDLLLTHNNKVKNVVGYCTWETNKLPSKWVDSINLVPEVWVPSVFNKECFINSGVKSIVKVVPHIWHPQKLINKDGITIYDHTRNVVPKNKYTFYSIGEFNFRKGIEDLVTVFDKFNDNYPDTQLLLKIHYRDYHPTNRQYCIDAINKLTNKLGTSIHIILDNLSNRDILGLHSFGDCYVSLNKGEGFGLTIFDAFNYGKQVITTGYGGQTDYLGLDYDGLVKYKIDKVSGMESFSTNYSVDQEWAYPDLDHVYELMKIRYDNKI
jgi:glycosyltransferase involved in cell wall biosynthesis